MFSVLGWSGGCSRSRDDHDKIVRYLINILFCPRHASGAGALRDTSTIEGDGNLRNFMGHGSLKCIPGVSVRTKKDTQAWGEKIKS